MPFIVACVLHWCLVQSQTLPPVGLNLLLRALFESTEYETSM